jgi:transcriptional regulator with XRE-family HTH domain
VSERTPDEQAAAEKAAGEQMSAVLAANLLRLRTARGLSHAALSARTGRTPTAFSHIERERRHTLLSTVEVIAGALGVSPTKLLTEPACPHCGDVPPAGYSCLACRKWRAA